MPDGNTAALNQYEQETLKAELAATPENELEAFVKTSVETFYDEPATCIRELHRQSQADARNKEEDDQFDFIGEWFGHLISGDIDNHDIAWMWLAHEMRDAEFNDDDIEYCENVFDNNFKGKEAES